MANTKPLATQVAFTQTGAGAKSDTLDSLARFSINAYQFTGVDPTGATDSTTGLLAAIATGKSIDLGGKENIYLVSSTLALNAGQTLLGKGATLKTTSNIRIVTMADNCVVDSVRFLGNDSGSAQVGVYIYGVSRTKVSNCTFVDFGGAGYWVEQIVGNHQGNTLVGSTFTSCAWGINIAERGEYTTITGCNVDTCGVGIRIIGGNTNVAGCVSSDCTIGILVGQGSNDAHGSVTGCLVNHSTQYAVKCESPSVNDFRFSDCEFYYGDLWMYRCNGMSFSNCTFGSNGGFYFEGSIDTFFESCRFINLPTFYNSHNAEPSKTHWVDTQFATALTGGSSAPNINGGYVEVKLASNVTAGAGVSIVPFDTLVYNAITNDLNYTYQSFWDGTGGVKQLQNMQALLSPNKTFFCDFIGDLSIGGDGVTVDYSKISVYLYNVASQKVFFFTPEPFTNGSNPGTSWRRYTFAGRINQDGPWRVVIDNQTGVTLTLFREQGTTVPFTIRATNF